MTRAAPRLRSRRRCCNDDERYQTEHRAEEQHEEAENAEDQRREPEHHEGLDPRVLGFQRVVEHRDLFTRSLGERGGTGLRLELYRAPVPGLEPHHGVADSPQPGAFAGVRRAGPGLDVRNGARGRRSPANEPARADEVTNTEDEEYSADRG